MLLVAARHVSFSTDVSLPPVVSCTAVFAPSAELSVVPPVAALSDVSALDWFSLHV